VPAENESTSAQVKRKVLRPSREPGVRLQVLAIWAFVAILFVATKAPDAWRLLELASICCLSFFLWPFIQGPFLLHSRHKNPLRADYRVVKVSEPQNPHYRVRDLLGLGFEFAGELAQDPGPRNVAARLDMFLHEQNKDSAQLAQVITGLGTIELLVFKSRFEDGFAFETSNGHTAPLFKPDPNYRVFRFPDVRSTSDLYRLHFKLKEQFAANRRPALADKDGELAEFIARAEVSHRRHAQSGDYKLSPAGDYYLYTWKGAVRHAWLLAWPIQSFRSMRLHSQGMKLAEQLGMPINPKFGRLQDSLPRPDGPRRRMRT
jgi:hypothetical protein